MVQRIIPKQDPKICKVYFVCVLPSGNDKRFKRYAYFPVDTSIDLIIDLIILHYFGDESIVIDFPHGNSHHCQLYYCTCPLYWKNLNEEVEFKILTTRTRNDSLFCSASPLTSASRVL